MTQLDHHIIASLGSLSDEGREQARSALGASKKKKVKKDNTIAKQKMKKALFT